MALVNSRAIQGSTEGPLGIVLLGLLALFGATLVSESTGERAILLVVGSIAAIVAFLRTELSIHFLIFAMLLSPEIAVGQTIGATNSRAITLRIDDFIIVLIAIAWFLKGALSRDLLLIRKTPLNNAMMLYSVLCLGTTLWGVIAGRVSMASGSLFVLKYIEYFVVFWMVVNTARSREQVNRYLLSVFVVGLIVSIIGIMQIPSGQRVSTPFEGEQGEPNTMGGYLLLLISLLAGIALCWKRWRVATYFVLGAMLLAMTYTLSRSTYLGFVPIVMLIPFLTRKYVLVPALIVVALIVLLSPSLLPGAVYDRVMFTFTQRDTQASRVEVFGSRVDSSTSARLLMFSEATQAFLERPVIGWGVTGWRFVDSQYFRTLVETGVLGFGAFLYLLYRVMRVVADARNRFRDTEPLYFGLASGFLVGLAGLMIHAIGSNTFIIVRIMEPFWLVCALLVVLPELTSREQAVPGTEEAGHFQLSKVGAST